ncbi:putative mitochondrial protein [Tanacetum coccineum]
MLKQLKNFLDLQPHAMSTSSGKCFASSSSKWILDSGAIHHMSYLMSQFISLNLNSSKSIVAANGNYMPLTGIGSVNTPSVALSGVYYILSLTMNLASVSKICDSGCDVNFSVSDCSIYDQKTQKVVGQTFCTNTPQQNGVAERKHRHIVKTTRSFLVSADVPRVFWGEAVLIATYVINRIPTAHNSGLSPFEMLYETLPDYSSLCGVMVEELTALHQIHTWDLVPLPTGKQAIGSRWVYKIKTKSNGFVKRYKGRLVVEGYSQEYGMDYEETFAHVAKMTTAQTLIAVAFSCQ